LKPRVYLETTIPSYLVGRPSRDLRLAADQQATLEWWEQRRHHFELFISQFVIAEASRGDPLLVAARLEKLRDIPIIGFSPAGEQLAQRLLEERIIPAVAAIDAAHIGYAAANGADYLLTWNCSHINNLALLRKIERVCVECGLACPVVGTPAELMNV
jgi:hypothetical protein